MFFMSEIAEIADFAVAEQLARPVNGKVSVPSEIAKFDEPSLLRFSPELDEQSRRGSPQLYVQFGGRRDGNWDKLLAKLNVDEREYFDRLSDIASQVGFKILLYKDNGNAVTPCAKSSKAQQAMGGLAPRALRRVQDYIDAHLSEDINVQVLASLVGLSSCYFARAFKQSVGTTPHHYLMERRLRFSKKLLIETELPLAQIAVESGFSDQSHFSRRFRRVFGITPRSFRWASR
jgi:AraC-like DNA-binding protein